MYESLKQEIANTPTGARMRELVRGRSAFRGHVPAKSIDELTELVIDRWIGGNRPESMVKDIVRIAPMLSSDNALLLARTEAANVSTSLIQARTESLGLPFYQWYTCKDERVRPSHKIMQDVICQWSDPPAPERLIGEDPNGKHYHPGCCDCCRCMALPVISVNDISFPARVYINGSICEVYSLAEFERLLPNCMPNTQRGNAYQRIQQINDDAKPSEEHSNNNFGGTIKVVVLVILIILATLVGLFGLLGAFVGISDKDAGMTLFFAFVAVVMFFVIMMLRKKLHKKNKATSNTPTYIQQETTDIHQVEQVRPAEPTQEKKHKLFTPDEIEYAVIAGQESTAKLGSAIGRGAAGAALLGPVGLLAGGTAKKNTTVTLILHYKSGKTKNVQCKLNSSEFKIYSKYIR